MLNRLTKSRTDRRGATTVEFALTASIVFLLFFGLVEFARFHAVRHSLDQAAYEGARAGIVPGATAAQVRARAESVLRATGIRNETITVLPADFSSNAPEVTVTVESSYADNSWAASKFFTGVVLSAQSTLDREDGAVSE